MSKPSPSLELLRVFEACGRCQGFTAAAAELGMTQPAVSQQMQRLERALGNPLFDRVHRGIRLTAAGQALLQPVQQALELVREAMATASARPQRSTLLVATDFAFAAYWLMPRLARFYQLHPDIDVNLVTSNRALSRLASDIDMAMVFGDGQIAGTHSQLLFREEVYPVCSPRLLMDTYGADSAELMRSAPLLHLKPATGQHWFDWQAVCAQAGWPRAPQAGGAAFDNYSMVLAAAVAGQGVAIGWRHLVDDLLDPAVLCRLPQAPLVSRYGYHLVTPQHRRLKPSARSLVNWLLQERPGLQEQGVDSRHG